MKKKHLFFLAGSLVIVSIAIISFLSIDKDGKYVPRSNQEVIVKKGYRGASEWIRSRRADTEGKIDPVAEKKARADAYAMSKLKSTSETVIEWVEMGPDNVGGRTRAILYDKDNHNILYAGAVSGGLWRSTTGGQSWNQSDLIIVDENDAPITNLNVSCITQAANGDIYFGTGELHTANGMLSGVSGNGIWKSTDGITFKRLNSTWGTSQQQSIFEYVNELGVDPNNPDRIYAATHKGIRVTNDGGETNWETVPEGISLSNSTKVCRSLKVASDGSIVTSINDKTFLSHDGGETFFDTTYVLLSYDNGLTYTDSVIGPRSPNGRLEYAISPTNPNYIYCHAAKSDGTLDNVYKSTDKGLRWKIIGPGGFNFQTLGDQGVYDNCIAVFPDDTAKIITGGQANMFTFSPLKSWEVVTDGYVEHSDNYSHLYVHADQHVIVFHPEYDGITNKTFLIGTDGGVFISQNGGLTFTNRNKNYNVTQFYTVASDGQGFLLGGTQDNGTQINRFTGNTDKNFFEIRGGDGGHCAMSNLNPNISFATVYYGNLKRSEEKGRGFDTVGKYFYNNYILNRYWAGLEGNIGGSPAAGFVTLFKLWEQIGDENSIDSVTYINTPESIPLYQYADYENEINNTYDNVYIDTVHFTNSFGENYVMVNLIIGAGETIVAKSQINELPIEFELPYSLYPEESINIKDQYQAMLAIPLRNSTTGEWNIMLTRKPLHFNVLKEQQPWAKLLPDNIQTQLTGSTHSFRDIEFSADGEYIFFAFNNALYRISGLSMARTRAQLTSDSTDYNLDAKAIKSFNYNINGIGIDPNNSDNVIVTLSGFGINDNVWVSDDATSANPGFTGKQGSLLTKLPSAPVFDGIINCMNSNQVMVTTEYGVFTTDNIFDINPDWTEQNNNNLGPVITPAIYQQTWENQWTPLIENHGFVYIGTHGRGIYKSETWAGPVAIDEPTVYNSSISSSLNVYPNPVVDKAQIEFHLSSSEDVKIMIYDLQGKIVKQLNLGRYSRGNHTTNIDLSNLTPGTYLINMFHNSSNKSTKIIVL
ncbi:MAG: T9SS type A sorting domain-containing protein [Bacteroidota bacterium]|nr:T9SS type A sorting domain-containing protein [Bacteroidota bacterium]